MLHGDAETSAGATTGVRPFDVVAMLRAPKVTYIQAPMVRYSRLPFRLLCRRWGVDVAYTHMMLADSFVQSQSARDAEFATMLDEGPLIAQFASPDPVRIGQAAVLIRPYCDALDINCGCPQRWALSEGIGGALMAKPELVRDMVRQVRNQAGDGFPCAVKMRLRASERETVDFARQLEAAGAAWLTVHGRTVQQRSSVPVDAAAVGALRRAVQLPVVHNGDVFTMQDVKRLVEATDAHGVMSARGLLYNPALFHGDPTAPAACVADYVTLSLTYGTAFRTFHHHLSCMLKDIIPRATRLEFQHVSSVAGVLQFLEACGLLPPDRPLPTDIAASPYSMATDTPSDTDGP